MLISDEKITESQSASKDFIWYLNLLNFDVVFNKTECEILREDCDEAVKYLELWKKEIEKLKKSIK